MHRSETLTQKVNTPFGRIYVHVAFDGAGGAREVRISTPGKHGDTSVGDALDAIGDAITQVLADDPSS